MNVEKDVQERGPNGQIGRATIRSLGLAIAVLLGCDAQAGSDYVGEPLLTLEGRLLVAPGVTVGEEVVAAVLWHDFATSDDATVTDPVEIAVEFPSAFRIDIVEPPPRGALADLEHPVTDRPTGKLFAMGYVAVLPSGSSGGTMESIWDDALGVSMDHLVVYAEVAITEEELRGVFPGGLEPGYQLFRMRENPARAEADACAEEIVACHDACFLLCDGDPDPCEEALLACLAGCEEAGTCLDEDPGHTHLLEPGSVRERLTIVLGGDKLRPDWF